MVDLFSVFIGVVITTYILLTNARIFVLEQKIKNLPTIKQLAEEVLKYKMPVEDLPPELKNAMMAYASGIVPEIPANKIKPKETYIG